MSRPRKATVDYFPHYVAGGKTLFTLENMYGNDGYAFWFKLLELLAMSDCHHYRYENIADWLYLVSRSKVSEEKATLILGTLADLNAIDLELNNNKIIYSENFINGLRPVYAKRSTEIPLKPSLRGENQGARSVSGEKTPQSKVKKSRGEKSKEQYGTFKNVSLTQKEKQKLDERFNSSVNERIDALSEYMRSKDKKYKNHFATILTWARRDAGKMQKTTSESGVVY